MGRKIIIVRHGKRMDYTFGKEWIQYCFASNGKYTKTKENMPDSVPVREPSEYLNDCPLTELGYSNGILAGKGLRETNLLNPGFHLYVSPSLRSVQTALAITEGMEMPKLKMKVEAGLFEWTGIYPSGNPIWMTPIQLVNKGFNVDTTYKPFENYTDLETDESLQDYYHRSHALIQHLLLKDGKDILIVAHGGTLDALTRKLLQGQSSWFVEEPVVPYCGIGIAELNSKTGMWSVVSGPEIKTNSISVRRNERSDNFVFEFVACDSEIK